MAFRGGELIGIAPHDGGTFDELGFAGSSKVYGVLREQLNEWELSQNTFDLARVNPDLPLRTGGGEMLHWNDVLFLPGRRIVDRRSLQYQGIRPNGLDAIAPVVSAGRIFSYGEIPGANGYFLSALDPRDFELLGIQTVPSSGGTKLLPATEEEFAVLNGGSILFVKSPLPLRGPWFTRDSITNSASYRAGPVASGEFLSIFGTDLSEGTHATPDQNLPEELGGAKIRMTDSTGRSRYARLHLSSPSQINLVVPEGLAPGPVELALERAGLLQHTVVLQMAPAAPGLFGFKTAAEDVAAAGVAKSENGVVTFQPVFRCSGADVCEPEPVSLETGAILVLFATGLGQSPNDIRVEIGGLPVEILYAGPQGQYPGLDQINVNIPLELAGRGKVAIKAILGGQESNVVTVLVD